MRISFNEEALAEAEEATRWYRYNGGASPARAFEQELRRVSKLAGEQPGIGSSGRNGTASMNALAGIGFFPIKLETACVNVEAAQELFDFLCSLRGGGFPCAMMSCFDKFN